jgi:hypothetical protein
MTGPISAGSCEDALARPVLSGLAVGIGLVVGLGLTSCVMKVDPQALKQGLATRARGFIPPTTSTRASGPPSSSATPHRSPPPPRPPGTRWGSAGSPELLSLRSACLPAARFASCSSARKAGPCGSPDSSPRASGRARGQAGGMDRPGPRHATIGRPASKKRSGNGKKAGGPALGYRNGRLAGTRPLRGADTGTRVLARVTARGVRP